MHASAGKEAKVEKKCKSAGKQVPSSVELQRRSACACSAKARVRESHTSETKERDVFMRLQSCE